MHNIMDRNFPILYFLKHIEDFTPGSGWAAMKNEKDTTLTAIILGSKYFSNVRCPALSQTQTWNNPFKTYK